LPHVSEANKTREEKLVLWQTKAIAQVEPKIQILGWSQAHTLTHTRDQRGQLLIDVTNFPAPQQPVEFFDYETSQKKKANKKPIVD